MRKLLALCAASVIATGSADAQNYYMRQKLPLPSTASSNASPSTPTPPPSTPKPSPTSPPPTSPSTCGAFVVDAGQRRGRPLSALQSGSVVRGGYGDAASVDQIVAEARAFCEAHRTYTATGGCGAFYTRIDYVTGTVYRWQARALEYVNSNSGPQGDTVFLFASCATR